MTVSDYSKVDFIEIFNNPESLHEVNERGTNLWMSLIFQAIKSPQPAAWTYTTVRSWQAAMQPTSKAKRRQHRFRARYRHSHAPHLGFQRRSAADGGSPGNKRIASDVYRCPQDRIFVPKTAQVVLKGKDKTFTTSVSLDKPVCVSLNQLSGTDPIIPLLYEAPGINGAATVSNSAHVAALTSCGSAADTSSAAGQLKEIDALPAIEGLLCVSPVLYRD